MGCKLADHISFCVDGEDVIFLDLMADSYFALTDERAETFRRFINGERLAEMGDAGKNVISALVSLGALLECDDDIFPEEVKLPAQIASYIEDDEIGAARKRLMPLMFLSRMESGKSFRTLKIYDQVSRIRKRKSNFLDSGKVVQFQSMKSDAIHSANFLRYFFDIQDKCLLTSIAVVDALARFNLYPDLVIGVKARPFAAHAWVQDKEWVINDRVDTVSAFKPILVV